jgi:hypothetical protein
MATISMGAASGAKPGPRRLKEPSGSGPGASRSGREADAQLSSSSLSPVWPISTSRSLARTAQGLVG